MPILRKSTSIVFATLLLLLSAAPSIADQVYPPQIKTILEQRCMVCHGCYDAPCQLKLEAMTGLQRGAHKDKVYDGTRLVTAKLTRLFEDAQSTQEWRDKGFYPVLPENTDDTNTISRMLALKQQHPIPDGELLPDSFDLSLNREQQCPKASEFDSFAEDYPLWGMPYALPGLNRDEHATLSKWLDAGAPGEAPRALSSGELNAIADWEKFLNGASLKQRLMSRYIYEHLFIANLYFSNLKGAERHYRMVRSLTPPGQPVDIIATRRPYDGPGDAAFYYRLQPLRTAVLAKRHMPYALSPQRMQRWKSLFLEPEYAVSKLPTYDTKIASNPFVAFQEIPQTSRYKFMLDEAQFTIMGFIKGPVCRGQVALNVIDDHFWVTFLRPDRQAAQENARFLARESENLRMPSGKSNILVSLVDWVTYSDDQLDFLRAKHEYIINHTGPNGSSVDLNLIWDGDGHNDNAALTIFRHNDSASVVKGLVGQQPKTGWVIDYSLLERIHYLLVAGFDVFGNVGHQLETRLYMDFLRMEGEQNFLLFLPPKERIALRDFWYRDAPDHVKQYVVNDTVAFDRDTGIEYTSNNHKAELFDMLQKHVHGARAERYRITDTSLKKLHRYVGAAASFMPEVAFVEVLTMRGPERVYSLIHNRSFVNNTQLFQEDERHKPDEDYLTVAKGLIGAYPNMFFQVNEKELDKFVVAIQSMKKAQDYTNLVSRYGVRRNAPWFWQTSDKLYQYNRTHFQREAGLLDLNRYENR